MQNTLSIEIIDKSRDILYIKIVIRLEIFHLSLGKSCSNLPDSSFSCSIFVDFWGILKSSLKCVYHKNLGQKEYCISELQ